MPNTIPASQQFAAIAWLRWRLFANGFRRKGGTGELIARIIVFPIAAVFVVGPVLGGTLASWAAVSKGHPEFLTGIFWGVFALQIVVSINISPPGLSFDPESLIRFPVSFPRYLTIRLFLGLLSVSTIIGTLALIGAASGAAYANPKLAPIAFAAALSLALCNMLFVRTLFAWIDRWLSTRRSRELFTGLILVFSIGIQYANVTINGVGTHTSRAARQAKYDAIQRSYAHLGPALRPLPPSLAGAAIRQQSVVYVGAVLLFALLFLAIFAWRMHREYRGENLSEAATQTPTEPVPHPGSRTIGPKVAHPYSEIEQTTPNLVTRQGIGEADLSKESTRSPAPGLLSPVVQACFEKEWIYVRRNPAQFYGLIAPLAMVFIFAGRMGSFARTGYVFPAAVAYSVLGIAALAYNILGLDAAGIQFYFIAPISLRDVMLGKNLFGFSITAIQLVLVYVVLAFISGPPPLLIALSTVCWVVFASLVNASIGNMRSITAPKKIDPNKISRKQASQLSALMCIGIMLAIGALGAGIMLTAAAVGIPWLPIPILAALAVGAFALYSAGLHRADAMALSHRESLLEELCKAS